VGRNGGKVLFPVAPKAWGHGKYSSRRERVPRRPAIGATRHTLLGYEPATGLSSDAGPEGASGPFPAATTLADGTVLLEAGQGAERFDPTTGSFRPTGGLRASHGQHTATRFPDDRGLIIGGSVEAPELYTP
jgi:hypothetical protein